MASYDVEEVPIELPDWDETQQIDDPEDQREVALFLEVQDGKVKGAETTPFILPHRWTYATLRHCVEDFVFRNYETRVKKLFYKRAKGKAVVCLDSDGDIPSLMKEYPLKYPSGKKKSGRSTVMYLAVQLEVKDKTPSPSTTPRRSPRFIKAQNIFVHKYDCEDKKVTTTAQLLHNVDNDANLAQIIELLQQMDEDDSVFVPKKGMFWLRKGTKQPVTLRNDKDLETCRKEYGNVAIRIACAAVDTQSPGRSNCAPQRKRRLNLSQGEASGSNKSENQLWNEIHINVVKDLEKRGILWRYSTKHLKLWTDMIVEGRLSGVGEEPKWEEHLEQVLIPPKSRRSTSPGRSSSTASDFTSTGVGGHANLLEMLLVQNQQRMEAETKRTEMYQTALLTMMSNTSAMLQNYAKPSCQSCTSVKQDQDQNHSVASGSLVVLQELRPSDCLQILEKVGLQRYISSFRENQIDGPMLEAMIHPALGDCVLTNLGIENQEDQTKLIAEIQRVKKEGFSVSINTISK